MEYKNEDLEAAIIDLLDGEDANDIHKNTGLSEERCEEIITLLKQVRINYDKRHGISS